MPHSVILGTGSYAPLRVLTNADLEKTVATNDAWIVGRTGIKQRRIAAADEATSDMAAAAARRALELAGVAPTDIDMIVVGTVTPDTPTPSCAAFVQAKLGAVNAFAFDVSAACAGSLYGLSIADQFIKSGMVRRALIIGAETMSRVVDWSNRETCVLFGDGAGAILLGASEEPGRGVLAAKLRTDGSMTDILGIFGGGSRRPWSPESSEQRSAESSAPSSLPFWFWRCSCRSPPWSRARCSSTSAAEPARHSDPGSRFGFIEGAGG